MAHLGAAVGFRHHVCAAGAAAMPAASLAGALAAAAAAAIAELFRLIHHVVGPKVAAVAMLPPVIVVAMLLLLLLLLRAARSGLGLARGAARIRGGRRAASPLAATGLWRYSRPLHGAAVLFFVLGYGRLRGWFRESGARHHNLQGDLALARFQATASYIDNGRCRSGRMQRLASHGPPGGDETLTTQREASLKRARLSYLGATGPPASPAAGPPACRPPAASQPARGPSKQPFAPTFTGPAQQALRVAQPPHAPPPDQG